MFEELTPGMRFNYGNAISAKDDSPPCIRRRTTLRDNPKFFEQYEYTEEDKAWFYRSIADENDTCTCEPGNVGLVWSQMMEAGLGPDDDWFVRSEQSREDDLAFFLEEASYEAERYERNLGRRYGGM